MCAIRLVLRPFIARDSSATRMIVISMGIAW